jgi:hypothetical protein
MPAELEKLSEIMDAAVSTELLFTDDYRPFVTKRASDLTQIARSLCAISP